MFPPVAYAPGSPQTGLFHSLSALHNFGAAQYRAGQYEQAAGTLEESIKLHGRGGYVNTRLFLAMTRQRLGQNAEARRLFDSWATWLKAQDFKTWQEEVQWRRLHEETTQLILTMPRAENGQRFEAKDERPPDQSPNADLAFILSREKRDIGDIKIEDSLVVRRTTNPKMLRRWVSQHG